MDWVTLILMLEVVVITFGIVLAYMKGHKSGYKQGYDAGYAMRPLEDLPMPERKNKNEKLC